MHCELTRLFDVFVLTVIIGLNVKSCNAQCSVKIQRDREAC